ncbi:MAG: TRAP transporter large permease [Rhodospirillaceae bacterium]|nr:TRAP transporter large permease [Rhodospirillaceae bacterium]
MPALLADPVVVGALMFALVLVLMVIGLPVAFAFLGANLIGAVLVMGANGHGLAGLLQLVDNSTNLITSFILVAIPMFIVMGALLFHTGLANRVFDALDLLFGRIPGRLCYLTLAGGTAFAALSGSSVANAAMLGSLLGPEMQRRGYAPRLILGPIMGVGGLAIIIPPSALAVLLGSLAKVDIGALLIAGILPGLLLAVLYVYVVWIDIRRNPDAAPIYDIDLPPWPVRLKAVAVNVLPMGLVVFCVVGLIILGVATPSESAALGAAAVVVLAACYRRLSWASITAAFASSVSVTGMLFVIIFASAAFSQLLAFSGASSVVVQAAVGWDAGATTKFLLVVAVLLALGMFLDQISILLITVPFIFPVMKALGFDPIWFGVVVMIAMEMSLLTPPFGLLLFLMLGVARASPQLAGTTMTDVVKAAVPYLICNMAVIGILMLWPGLATWLPKLMK